MIRGFGLFAVVLIFAWETAIVSRAAEPTQKLVRVGFVSPFSPSTVRHSLTAFWDRLRELGYV